ncbi:putative Ribosomal protein L6e [Monocercomonoides exilis]|uniref:putative Ribosomal protein L6e n=1 Tax=Monocercomonoides exilis TaxID=2049356 RepID=UPI00355A93D1|nr:putative Ribosomal protein L6e [Monocercomonoides exilis]|eukprot:MONOS_7327.1-p1 / transcript=MONOS_7327.1 / gene=MONOS_7327 / organism=Monocercomonoides_exilis_PA203 / gene_product=Ribosomal protein L6e / transcript_product=Ribosomal protein L6e / location=Mono_scaffold00248:11843-12495(-) / protein_length=150 / sequence_SO=supercontig / SO=protein_coding / is_pseudo=false
MKLCKPGQIAIVLAGRNKGRRVVCLKNLKNGLILCTGPYKLNGVPLRRFNRAYLILTKTRVNVSKVDLSGVREDMFRKKKLRFKKAHKDDFTQKKQRARNTKRTKELLALQKTIDKPLMQSIRKIPRMQGYLKSFFTLTNTQRPHMMRF